MAYPLCFLLLLMLPLSTINAQNITLGLSLTARDGNDASWASPSGEFAFGFQWVGTEDFLLAIWFNKIPEKTIIWSAKLTSGDYLVKKGSKVELTMDGQFVLNDPKGQRIWNAVSSDTGVTYAAMLDTGNFVLANQESVNLWESFEQPTDTILPTQTLNLGSKLVARYSEMNYSRGRFQFSLQGDGNLVLYTLRFPTGSVNFAYWASTTVGSGFQVIFNQSGYIYLTGKNGSILTPVTSNEASTRDFYQRAILEYDGVLRQYVYPKTNGSTASRRWPMAWSLLSTLDVNICMRITQDTGGGACGFNSYCVLEDDDRPKCKCPSGYDFLDPSNEMNGCKQKFVSQNCNEESRETSQFEFREMPNTDWPRSDYEQFEQVTEDWCRGACLDDCFCAVAIFRNQNCWKKRIPLSNGRLNDSVGGKALIKIRKGNSTSLCKKKKDQSTLILIGSVLLGSSVFLNLAALIATFLVIFWLNRRKPKMLKPHPVMPGTNLQSFTFKELEDATDGFKEELGKGASATVYKGVIAFENNKFVAVKKLDKIVRESEQEFKTEVSAIGRTNHKNLVQLLGFCNEGQHKILVYEFMSNGSLSSFLFGDSRPNWYKRVQIAFGTARGLFYLHDECSTQIIHCDIKPQNILLDDSFTARISDFGLAKLLKTDQTRTTTGIRGTKGYVAPEWFKNMPVTVKADVYSFGILLLELILCRKNYEPEAKDENQMILADWAYDCYKEGKLDLLVENDEEAIYDMKRLAKYVMIAIWCIQEDPSPRPTMKKVTLMLEGVVEVSVPPDPSSFISSI